jgi:hypothetical protein
MALNLAKFKEDLKDALLEVAELNATDGTTLETAIERLANAVATEVDKYILTATVKTIVDVDTVNTAVEVVNATPMAPGPVTGTGTGTGSGTGEGHLE